VNSAIEVTPGVCGGEPCLAGTRITMAHFRRLTKINFTYDDILRMYPHLDPDLFRRAMREWRKVKG
jgi:uncharacterized protein (DUF433 family)